MGTQTQNPKQLLGSKIVFVKDLRFELAWKHWIGFEHGS